MALVDDILKTGLGSLPNVIAALNTGKIKRKDLPKSVKKAVDAAAQDRAELEKRETVAAVSTPATDTETPDTETPAAQPKPSKPKAKTDPVKVPSMKTPAAETIKFAKDHPSAAVALLQREKGVKRPRKGLVEALEAIIAG